MLLLNDYEQEITSMLVASKRDMQQTILSQLSKKMFTNRLFAKVFEIAELLFNSGKEVNVFNIAEKLYSNEDKKNVLLLQENFITNVNYKFYVNKIQEAYFDRITKNATCYNEIEKIQKEKEKYTDTSLLLDITHDAEKLLEKDENVKLIKTGYPSIDSKLGCMQGGDLIIFAGAPGMGKTCMMINLIASIAKQGFKVDVFSLEMSLKQIQNRLICSQARIDASKLRTQTLTGFETDLYQRYIYEVLPSLPIKICTKYSINVEKIKALTKKSDSDIVFIDYLGLISGGNQKSSYERIGDISRELKLAAMETNKPFYVLHQLNRGYADRQDKRPRLSDLRDSGKIEQDADTVCFIHRPAYFEPDKYRDFDLRFIIEKSMHTEGGKTAELYYDASTQTVKEKFQHER